MLLYNVIRSNVTPTAAQDFFTIISNATRSFAILELDAEGAGTASAYTETGVYRVGTAGATGGGAITPVPVNPALAAAGFTVDTTWTTQPTVGALIQDGSGNQFICAASRSKAARCFFSCAAMRRISLAERLPSSTASCPS